MIDFRFHLITIIAVLLALSLGILVGSGFLGAPLLEDVKQRAEDVNAANDRLRELADRLKRDIDDNKEFEEAAELLLTAGELRDRRVVMFVFEHTDGGVVDDIRNGLESAGASVPTTIRLSDRFRLQTLADQDQLALILRTSVGGAADLRQEAGALLGSRVAAVADDPPGRDTSPGTGRLGAFTQELEEAAFISVESSLVDEIVPQDAMFLIVGGDKEPAGWDLEGFITALGAGLGETGAAVLVAEPSDSNWGIVQALRIAAETAGVVATVDQAETVSGRIAIVLGLGHAELGIVGHYGVGDGATDLLPQPASEL